MTLFNTHSGGDLSGKALPVGHCSENSCPLALLPWESCGGHPQGWGERPVPVYARAWPTEPGARPSHPVVGGPRHAALSCQSWHHPGVRSSTARLPCPLEREGAGPTTPLPQRKGRVLKQKSANAQKPKEGGLNHTLLLGCQ